MKFSRICFVNNNPWKSRCEFQISYSRNLYTVSYIDSSHSGFNRESFESIYSPGDWIAKEIRTRVDSLDFRKVKNEYFPDDRVLDGNSWNIIFYKNDIIYKEIRGYFICPDVYNLMYSLKNTYLSFIARKITNF